MEEPVTALYIPAEHEVHTDACAALNVPKAQSVHELLFVTPANVPDAHGVHALTPPVE